MSKDSSYTPSIEEFLQNYSKAQQLAYLQEKAKLEYPEKSPENQAQIAWIWHKDLLALGRQLKIKKVHKTNPYKKKTNYYVKEHKENLTAQEWGVPVKDRFAPNK